MLPPSITVVFILALLVLETKQDMTESIPASRQMRLPSVTQLPSINLPGSTPKPAGCSCTAGIQDASRDYGESAVGVERAIMAAAMESMSRNDNKEARRVLGIVDQLRKLRYDLATPFNVTQQMLKMQNQAGQQIYRRLLKEFKDYSPALRNGITNAQARAASRLRDLMKALQNRLQDGIAAAEVARAVSTGFRSATASGLHSAFC